MIVSELTLTLCGEQNRKEITYGEYNVTKDGPKTYQIANTIDSRQYPTPMSFTVKKKDFGAVQIRTNPNHTATFYVNAVKTSTSKEMQSYLAELVTAYLDSVKDALLKRDGATLTISYSWGDEEPVRHYETFGEACAEARSMAIREAETAGTDHSSPITLSFFNEQGKFVIDLLYGYDREHCYYTVTED